MFSYQPRSPHMLNTGYGKKLQCQGPVFCIQKQGRCNKVASSVIGEVHTLQSYFSPLNSMLFFSKECASSLANYYKLESNSLS